MDRDGGVDPFAELKEAGEEYKVYDSHYEKIGQVDDLIADEDDQVLYVGVKMGFFGTNSTLIPVEILRINDKRRLIEVSEPAETIKHAPHFGHDETVSPELEDRVRTYFGLEPLLPPRQPEEPYPSDDTARFGPDARVDVEPGERVEAQDRLAGTPTEEPAAAPTAGEPLGATPEDRWDRQVRAGGVIVHRKRG